MTWLAVLLVAVIALVGLTVYDVVQRRHTLLRNFPVIGHLRFLLEGIGPELRQYIVTGNDEERPFSRDQRSWVYASAKKENNYVGYGTDNDLDASEGYVIVKQATFPLEAAAGAGDDLPCAKVLGGPRGRRLAVRPASVVNASGMSFGSLSGPAIEAINRGSALAGCWQNTGEGGLSPYHRLGGDLVFQIGTGYFGCRDATGRFDLSRLRDIVAENPVRAIEIKLSQGAKPGLGGVLPGAKVSPEIAAIRGVPVGITCVSPSRHSAFSDVDSLLDFVEGIADATGLPVGIKSAVGESGFWEVLADEMARGGRAVDFINIDGGEGGTGAAPLTFSDHVSLPFRVGFARVYRLFAERDVAGDVVFAGAGRLGFPDAALFAFALGCDLVSVGREAMMSVGCIQAQRCHTGRCPTGVATQNRWLTRGLDPTLKSVRFANYVATLRHELLQLSLACGVAHPALVGPDRIELLDGRYGSTTARELFAYEPGWGVPRRADQVAVSALMRGS
ncbi:MAG TPA: FMN-binding glutamate synthase family protein [Acidimicrobiales bacterium]